MAQPANNGHSADAFAALLNPARPRMFLVALAIVADRTEAEDVLQDATITGLTKYRAGEFAHGTNFDAWMGQITRYTALNARRSRRNGPASLGDSAGRLPTSHRATLTQAGPMDAIEDADLRSALAQLAEAPRLCLVLRIVGGLPYSTIAQIVGIPEGTAMSHVHRAQRALRQVLLSRSQNDRSSPAAVARSAPRTTSQGGAQ
jgi:RNA polymerase sigma-70 factor (ECF subfamily)